MEVASFRVLEFRLTGSLGQGLRALEGADKVKFAPACLVNLTELMQKHGVSCAHMGWLWSFSEV